MQKAILLFSLILGLLTICNVEAGTKEIKAKGVYSEIAVDKQNETIKALQDKDKKLKKQIIETVINKPNAYNPPVLYALSRELFLQGDKDDASFWFYVAQLRARYDANLCMDNSAKQAVSILNREYGPDINKFALQDIEKLEKTVKKVVDFVRTNHEDYDHRWINLHGMDAVLAGMNDNVEKKELSQPKDQWNIIKKKTVDDYYNGFIEFVKNKK